jgi:acyl-CoA oxidase
MGQVHRLAKIAEQLGPDRRDEVYELGHTIGIYSESFSMRFGVHILLFKNVINMLSSDEQRKYWLPLVEEMRIIGCFAMVSKLLPPLKEEEACVSKCFCYSLW